MKAMMLAKRSDGMIAPYQPELLTTATAAGSHTTAVLQLINFCKDHKVRCPNDEFKHLCDANALEVLALLDCAVGECLEAEFVIAHPERGPLATPRAAEIARQYREHVASAAARVHLRVGFQVAGEAFRETYPDAVLSGAGFYRFLARSDLYAGPREDLDTLAELFAQVDLLGLPPVDAAIVQERLALDFASAAALPGFDVPVVVAAVEASPVGLLR